MNDISTTTLERELTLAIEASEQLLILAQADQWQDFERQFRQRDTVLRRLDVQVSGQLPLSDETGKHISAQLQALRELNDRLLQIAEASKAALSDEIAKDRKARQALNAYKRT